LRFLYFDRLLEVERGVRIRGVKTFPLSEAYFKGHFSRAPVVPGTVLIEAMAQITGWLVVYSHGFETSCVISLIDDVTVPADLRPGATVEIEGRIVDTNKQGSLCAASVEQGGETIARAGRFIFPHFPSEDPDGLRQRFRDYGWLEPRWDGEAS